MTKYKIPMYFEAKNKEEANKIVRDLKIMLPYIEGINVKKLLLNDIELRKEAAKRVSELREIVTGKKIGLYLYIIRVGNSDCYKIGSSCNVKGRIKDIQGYNTDELKLVHKYKIENMSIEKQLHKKYKHKRIRGEWFRLIKKDIGDIKKWLRNLEQN